VFLDGPQATHVHVNGPRLYLRRGIPDGFRKRLAALCSAAPPHETGEQTKPLAAEPHIPVNYRDRIEIVTVERLHLSQPRPRGVDANRPGVPVYR
jgi:hypothetical protein